MLYVFGGCKQSSVKKKMSLLDFDYLGWKRSLPRNGTLYKNSKLYAYSKLFTPLTAKSAGLSIKETNALDIALEYDPCISYLRSLRNKLRCHPMSLQQIDHFYGKTITSRDLQEYTSKFVYVKLRFLAQSYGFTMAELKSSLLSNAYFALLKQYPNFENEDHLIKLAKVAVHNTGTNLILQQTAKKRNKLLQNSDGTYYRTETPLSDDNQSVTKSSEEGYISTSFLVTGLDGRVHSDWYTSKSIEQLRAGDMLTTKQKKYISLALGESDEEFVEFLGDHADLYERDHPRYLERVGEFLGVSPERQSHFLQSLKKFL